MHVVCTQLVLSRRLQAFAIVFNRAALHAQTENLARRLGLKNVLGLLGNNKLHIVYFQSDSAMPTALARASKAMEKAEIAEQKAAAALKAVQGMGASVV